ncbi:MAG: DUF11 domain-containing protein [Proteobacteria bacterium]|nr:DUF11 domain-containing protein [Pseudomonadota bacterium]
MKKIGLLTITALMLFTSLRINAQTICAIVKIEIRQELSFERQAFNAKMIITNGLDIVSLENLDIDVHFEDIDGNPVLATSDPDNTNAKFFIRIDNMTGVNDVNGSGVITAGQVAEINWLIIPAPGTGGLTPAGLRYGVGATVNYTFGEESQTVNVVPDFITVTPTPLLKLDYFLPTDVFGDNPLTPEVESIEPFDLGLRISNTGAGFADDLQIESAQPQIIENDQGLLIDFELLGTSVNDSDVNNSLLAYIGRLEAGESAMVSWLMQSSLNGEFISFEADFVHSDELGGQLTSLIDAPIDTHILFHRVIVDYAGRDQIRDFLAYDEDILRVYESNGGQAQVIDESDSNVVTNLGVVDGKQKYQINFDSVAGASFARWTDPYNGVKQEVTAFRSDGKLLPASNVWQYRIETNPGVFEFYFGIFDVDSTGQYEMIINGTEPNVAPVITVVSPQNAVYGTQMMFDIDVSDGNFGDVLSLVSIGAPATSSVSFVAGGTWQFSWLPQSSDVGTIDFILAASDGSVQTDSPMQLIITAPAIIDTDADGMDDDWEQQYFGNLDEDGTGDYDQDSAIDLQEYIFGGDPTLEDRPQAPQIVSPINGENTSSLIDEFIIINAIRAVDATVVYEFELYENEISDNPIVSAMVDETNIQTTWSHGGSFVENNEYIWRVRAFDGITPSHWSYDDFKYSAIDNAPINCGLDFPTNAQVISTNKPFLSVVSATDADSSDLQYLFQLYSDVAMTDEIANSGWLNEDIISVNNDIRMQWQPYNFFFDVTSYYWSASVRDESTTVSCGNGAFSLNLTTTMPYGYSLSLPLLDEITDVNVDIVIGHDMNAVNSANYSYYFEVDTNQTFTSVNLQQSPSIVFDINNQATWSLTGLQNDTLYFWRVKANDGLQDGRWVYSQFRTQLVTSVPTVYSTNPSNESWVSSKNPVLAFYLAKRIKTLKDVTIEIYADDTATNLLFTQDINNQIWTAPSLTDRQYYYWQVKANLKDGSSGDFSPLQKFFVIDDQNNQVPSFEFVSLTTSEENLSDIYPITWLDSDMDSNASIALYYDDNNTGVDGSLIASAISEDDLADVYQWDVSDMDNGDYYLYALVSDGQSSLSVYSDNSLKLLHHEIGVIASGTTTSEAGDSITVNVAINKLPIDFVMVSFDVSDNTESSVNVNRLIFTPDNWMDVQQFTVSGVDDSIIDGDKPYELSFNQIQSHDQSYASLELAPLSFVNIDDETGTPMIDLSMDKSIVSSGPYNVGSNVNYQLIVSNQGSDDATDVVVTDSMTNLSLVSTGGGNCMPVDTFPCTIASIPGGDSRTITIVSTLDSIGVFDNSASVIANIDETDTNLTNNTDDTNNGGTSVGANISVKINNDLNQLANGQNIIYELTAVNLGDTDINNITLSSDLSQYLDSINWSCEAFNGANCSLATGSNNVNEVMNLPIGSSITYLISANVIGFAGDEVQTSANISLPIGITDIDLSDNSSIDTDMITVPGLIFVNGFEN